MRRGPGAGEGKSGGAWQCAAMLREGESKPWVSADAVRTVSSRGETEIPCTDEGRTKGACAAGMVLQQSCPRWPCGEQGIDLQHCMACSGVVMVEQSTA